MRVARLTCQFTRATGEFVCKQIAFVCPFEFGDRAKVITRFLWMNVKNTCFTMA